jgi:hypothetical protein
MSVKENLEEIEAPNHAMKSPLYSAGVFNCNVTHRSQTHACSGCVAMRAAGNLWWFQQQPVMGNELAPHWRPNAKVGMKSGALVALCGLVRGNAPWFQVLRSPTFRP